MNILSENLKLFVISPNNLLSVFIQFLSATFKWVIDIVKCVADDCQKLMWMQFCMFDIFLCICKDVGGRVGSS